MFVCVNVLMIPQLTEVFFVCVNADWKVDAVMMDSVLRVCVPAVDKLHLLTLYNVGLTNHTLETLGHLVQECPNLK